MTLSEDCHPVKLLCAIAGVKVNIVNVWPDMSKPWMTESPQFQSNIGGQHTVPKIETAGVDKRLYPHIITSCYPTLGYPAYPGTVAFKGNDDRILESQKEALQKIRKDILKPLIGFFIPPGGAFVAGNQLTLADLQIVTKLNMLKCVKFPFTKEEKEYMERVAKACGRAWSDVCGKPTQFFISKAKKIAFEYNP